MSDVLTILSPFLGLWWVLILILVVLFFRSPFGKGLIGEALVNFAINIQLDKDEYYLIKDVTLPTETGTTQIDHILVSKYGVFVIETKNMKGWIFGDEHQKTWTQSIYKHKTKFQNPLHQNYKHVKTIETILGIDADKIFSIVVFIGDSTFKTDMPDNVTYASGLFRYINSKTRVFLSHKEVHDIISTIESGRLSRTIKTHREHVKHLKTRKEYVKYEKTHNEPLKRTSSKRESDFICPRCSNRLVLRVAGKGKSVGNEFYGCSSYPRCKYTRNK